ncbi:diguanylate cyclase [Salinisphaera sp.]|uniref:diguanylate cyclase domain-containing protein n=1 Tax=Salinisphaera sp. TaxID=1914330 RepID=UPI0026014421|nr:diguanylate cyclase [Salinisphaera sp.]
MMPPIDSSSEHSRPRILVVDDLYANRLAMRRVLATLEVEVVEADNGNDALAACIETEFALILLDVQMPGMDGMEVAEFLHGEESTQHTPVIFVTAGATDDMDRLKGYDVGAVDYITKPLNPSLLSAKVRNFIELYESRHALKRALAELDERNSQLEREIEERRRAEDRAQQLATHDALTGLPNRLLFLDRLATSMQRARRKGGIFALGYMDLDGFKPVNDEFGHGVGDITLQTIADRLRENTRKTDTVARFGGDEFALILENVDDQQACIALCEALRAQLSEPISLPCAGGSSDISVGVSIGLAFYPAHGENADRLMHNADRALYSVKLSGKGSVHVFSAADDEDTHVHGAQIRARMR